MGTSAVQLIRFVRSSCSDRGVALTADLDNLHNSLHELIVRETFSFLSSQDAVLLVGILHLFRITFSRQMRTLASKAFHWEPLYLEPLELPAAARLVASLTSVDTSALLREFREHWRTLRDSPKLRELVQQLEAHRLVYKLVPYTETRPGIQDLERGPAN